MNIKETFLKLTSKTYPHGTERQLFSFLPKGVKQDLWANYFHEIGNTKTIFACHLDTANKLQGKVKHKFDGDYIRTDGTTILGADDKAGVTILLWLIENKIPGTYYFFIGEEVGCIGSTAASKDIDRFEKYDRIVSFDRRDVCSVITHQSWSRTCSDKFADALISEIGKGGIYLKKDDNGVYTDSAEFTDVIPECTNISVGYYDEHKFSERQDIKFLEELCQSLLLVNWESLPTDRDPKDTEYKKYDYSDYDPDGWASSGNGGWNTNSGWSTNSSLGKAYMDEYHHDADFYNKDKDAPDDRGFDYKKTRRSGKKGSKFDSYDIDSQFDDPMGEDDFVVSADRFLEESIIDTKKSFQYGIIKELYLSDSLSKKEIEIIREQYLDMSNPDDVDFSEHLNDLNKF